MIPSLANAELAVMEQLWLNGSLTARQLQEFLYPDASKAQHGTVQKLLQRLEEKECVARDRTGPSHHFTAVISREDYACGQIESIAARLTGGALAPLITQLVESKRLSPDDIRQLRQMLEEE